ncbi:MAG: MFS transporter [Rikenellaceae bacterium]|nr:MFS transporter [Rikenellaceae bacterium]
MPRRLWAILAVAFGVGLSVLDSTIVNVALPTIAGELGVSESSSIWVVNGYQLATVMTMLSFSALANQVGVRRIYLLGLSLFTLASLGCFLARDFASLLAARVLQGVGAAAITSINTTVIRFIYPSDRLGRGMGLNATIVAVASVAGPGVASLILSMADWPWLFAINLPIGLVAILLSARFLPDNPERMQGRRFDWRDGVMNALCFGLLFTVAEAFTRGVSLSLSLPLLLLLLVAGRLFVRSQLRKENPILPFDLLRIPIFSFSVATSICSYVAQMSALVALPFFLQQGLGRSAVDTGLLMMAWPLVTIFTAPLAGRLVERIHAGWLGGVGLLTMALGLYFCSRLVPDDPTAKVVGALLLSGVGFSFFQSPNNSILVASAPPSRSGSASGMQGTARLVGQTSGAALVAALFRLYAPAEGSVVVLSAAAALALLGAGFSFSRLRLPLPEAIRPKRG